MFNVGVVGCGYWGPNLIRNFIQIERSNVLKVVDLNEDRLNHMQSLYPGIKTSNDYTQLINDSEIDIIAVATPVSSHFQIAYDALSSGKHVFVEKPIAASVAETKSLIGMADKMGKKLMVGHTFIYTGAVEKMKEIVDSGELGDIYYISSQRLNLGLFQPDINVLWDLAPHDIAIILFLLNQQPTEVSAIGATHLNPAIEDVAVLSIRFSGNLIAYVQTSWLDPDKVRKMTVVGSKKMMVFDDMQPTEKIRIYDKGVEIPNHYDTFAEFHYSYKYGDIVIPKLKGSEPLREELRHFLNSIESDEPLLSDGQKGLEVIRILEAADQSLKNGNCPIATGV